MNIYPFWKPGLRERNLGTLCVLHSYRAMMLGNCVDELDPGGLAAVIGSVAFVRNWQSFGQTLLNRKLTVETPQNQ